MKKPPKQHPDKYREFNVTELKNGKLRAKRPADQLEFNIDFPNWKILKQWIDNIKPLNS